MTRNVRLSARADADIRSIASRIARDSIQSAVKWVDDLNHQFDKLAEIPGIGSDRSTLRPQLRSVPFNNYIIFFKPGKRGIVVVRVIHGARDYSQFFDT